MSRSGLLFGLQMLLWVLRLLVATNLSVKAHLHWKWGGGRVYSDHITALHKNPISSLSSWNRKVLWPLFIKLAKFQTQKFCIRVKEDVIQNIEDKKTLNSITWWNQKWNKFSYWKFPMNFIFNEHVFNYLGNLFKSL